MKKLMYVLAILIASLMSVTTLCCEAFAQITLQKEIGDTVVATTSINGTEVWGVSVRVTFDSTYLALMDYQNHCTAFDLPLVGVNNDSLYGDYFMQGTSTLETVDAVLFNAGFRVLRSGSTTIKISKRQGWREYNVPITNIGTINPTNTIQVMGESAILIRLLIE